MGARVQKNPAIITAAVAGASLSTVATVIQMCLVLAATSTTTLRALSMPLICAGIAAAAYGAASRSWRCAKGTRLTLSRDTHSASRSR
jgi:hypothetical protein